MFEFRELNGLEIKELYEILGITDFTYIETNSFLEQLEEYRNKILKRIKDARELNNKDLDSRS